MKKVHILLQGFGSFPINFKALIARSRELGDDITWSIVCTTGHYVKEYKTLLGDEAVLYLHKDMSRYLGRADLLDTLQKYTGNIYRNIESEKRFTKHKKSMRQLRSAAAMYNSIKTFMQARQPTHVLFGQIEGLDGMTLLTVANELGVPSLVPSHTRQLGRTLLSPDQIETILPNRLVTETDIAWAKAYLHKFRTEKTSSAAIPEEVVNGPDEYYPIAQPSFFKRVLGALRRMMDEPEMREPDVIRASLFVNFPLLAQCFWRPRIFLNKRVYDLSSIDELPKKFAYYPLQYSPESSINTPAPYFVDQTRAIDAIRFSLPSDMMLVVKEHPTCLGLRPIGFLPSLQKKAGVIIAKYDVPSKEISQKAAITFSVSGTASFEAFMQGKPSLILGGAFFAKALGGSTGVDSLPERIQHALQSPPRDEQIIDALAEVYAASHPFITGSPFDKGSGFSKYSLKKTNIHNFYDAVKAETGLANP